MIIRSVLMCVCVLSVSNTIRSSLSSVRVFRYSLEMELG